MNRAFDSSQTMSISGDPSQLIRTLLTEDSTDQVLDLEVYENRSGHRCVAVAIQTECRGSTIVEGAIILVVPKPEAGKDHFRVSAVPEQEGPVANFSP